MMNLSIVLSVYLYILGVCTDGVSVNDAGFLTRVPRRTSSALDFASHDVLTTVASILGEGVRRELRRSTISFWMALLFFMEQNDFVTPPTFPKDSADFVVGVVAGSRRLTEKGSMLRSHLRGGSPCYAAFDPTPRPFVTGTQAKPLRELLGEAVWAAAVAAVGEAAAEHNIDPLKAYLLFPYASLRSTYR